jgi:hypothetical protein
MAYGRRAPPNLDFYDLRDSRAVEGGSEWVDAGVDLTFEDSLVFADPIAHALRFGTSSKLFLERQRPNRTLAAGAKVRFSDRLSVLF